MTEATPTPNEWLERTQGDDLAVESLNPAAAQQDGSKELYDQVRQRIARPGGLFFFCKGIIGFPDLTRRCHLALCLFIEDRDIKSKLVEYPRRHLKTSIVTIGGTLYCFARAVVLDKDPIDRFAICSSTKTNAMRMLRLVKLIPEQNQLFQSFLPELIPEFSNEEVWNQEEIVFPRQRAFPDPSVDTLGAGGKAASRHYTDIIEDDMVNEENWDSNTALKKAIELHQLYENLLEDSTNNYRTTNENSWTDFDLNHHIVHNEPETAVFSVGASGGLNLNRSRLLPPRVMHLTKAWENEESIWPERFDQHALVTIRNKCGARIYNAQYENQPFDPDVVDFKEEWLRYYERTKDGDIRVMPSRGVDMEIVDRRSLNIVAAFDPALGKKTENARSALVVIGVDPIGRVFVLDVIAIREDPLKVLDIVFQTIHDQNVRTCAVEEVLFQKVLIDLLEERCKFWNRDHPGDPIYPGTFQGVRPGSKQSKEARVRALIGSCFEEGRVYLHASQTKFIDEYLHFPIGSTVDILDAFAYTATLWAPGTDPDDDDLSTKLEDEWLATRDPVTGY